MRAAHGLSPPPPPNFTLGTGDGGGGAGTACLLHSILSGRLYYALLAYKPLQGRGRLCRDSTASCFSDNSTVLRQPNPRHVSQDSAAKIAWRGGGTQMDLLIYSVLSSYHSGNPLFCHYPNRDWQLVSNGGSDRTFCLDVLLGITGWCK